MRTVDTVRIHAAATQVFAAARDVERWPELLPHYRWVRFREPREGGGTVEMAAWRPFGRFRWPTWWVAEMHIEPATLTVQYRHVEGITTGMNVTWRIAPVPGPGGDVDVRIVHEWSGPPWPLGGLIARLVIGPLFVHGIASRTLAGIKRHVESAT